MTVWLEINGKPRRVELPDGLPKSGEPIVLDGQPITVDVRMIAPGVLSLIVEGRQYRCVLEHDVEGDCVLIAGQRFAFAEADPRSLAGPGGAAAGVDGPRAVRAPMPGRVVRVLVAVGDTVEAQQGLVVIEAMKMQNELKSPKPGRVARLPAEAGATVGAGDVLAVIE